VRRRKFNTESTRLQARRCDFGYETRSMKTMNRPSVVMQRPRPFNNLPICLIPECTVPDVFELIATMSSPLSRVHNDRALPSLSNGLPTVIEFVKAGALLMPSFNASGKPRGHMLR
jgi:hypothetical protein